MDLNTFMSTACPIDFDLEAKCSESKSCKDCWKVIFANIDVEQLKLELKKRFNFGGVLEILKGDDDE